MRNPVYYFEKMRELLDEFEPSRELSLAKTKLEECELWLTKCQSRVEAVMRDQQTPDKLAWPRKKIRGEE